LAYLVCCERGAELHRGGIRGIAGPCPVVSPDQVRIKFRSGLQGIVGEGYRMAQFRFIMW